MGLETGTQIQDLNPAWPLSTDDLSESDNHHRLIKQCIQGSFPGTTAPWAAPDQTPQFRNLRTQEPTQPDHAASRQYVDARTVPVGLVSMWFGALDSIPTGWALCDGTLANGVQTPDLRDRFIVGAGGSRAPGDTGGQESLDTDPAGGHTHGLTVNATALTPAQLPDISANLQTLFDPSSQSDAHTEITRVTRGRTGTTTWAAGAARTVGLNGQGHAHTATAGAVSDHVHEVETVPPFHALAFIIYVGVPA